MLRLLTGVSIIGVHPTSELDSAGDGRTNTDKPRSAADIHPASRRCHFTVVCLRLCTLCLKKLGTHIMRQNSHRA